MEGKRSLQVKRVSESNLKEDLEMHATLRQLTGSSGDLWGPKSINTSEMSSNVSMKRLNLIQEHQGND